MKLSGVGSLGQSCLEVCQAKGLGGGDEECDDAEEVSHDVLTWSIQAELLPLWVGSS